MFPNTVHVETVVKLSLKKDTPKIEVTMEPDEESNYTPEEKATYQKIKDYVKNKYGVNVHTSYIAQVKRMCGLDMGENYNKSKKENPEVKQCPQEKVEYIKDALRHFNLIWQAINKNDLQRSSYVWLVYEPVEYLEFFQIIIDQTDGPDWKNFEDALGRLDFSDILRDYGTTYDTDSIKYLNGRSIESINQAVLTVKEMFPLWVKSILIDSRIKKKDRIQEMLNLGYFDLYSKGGKLRRLCIPCYHCIWQSLVYR